MSCKLHMVSVDYNTWKRKLICFFHQFCQWTKPLTKQCSQRGGSLHHVYKDLFRAAHQMDTAAEQAWLTTLFLAALRYKWTEKTFLIPKFIQHKGTAPAVYTKQRKTFFSITASRNDKVCKEMSHCSWAHFLFWTCYTLGNVYLLH